MLTSTLTLSWSSLISMISPEKSAKGPSLTRTVSPMSYSNMGFDFFDASWLRSASTPRKFSTSVRRIGDGLPPWLTKPVTPGVLRMTYQASSSREVRHSRYPGKSFFSVITFLPFLNSGISRVGMTTS